MAKEKNEEELSTEKLKKLLVTYNLLAVFNGLISITAIVFYFINREDNFHLLIVGCGLGAGISFFAILSNKIKQELKRRNQ